MFRVTPIGSCRIAGPLQRAQDRLGIATNKGRVYGYCHSSGEAVQMARFLRGEFTPDADTWPFVSRGTKLAAISAQNHAPSNLYVIELSSAKRLTIDGVFVQLNYVANAFAAFFADDDRARAFWVRAEDGNQAAIDRFLAKQSLLDTDRAILRKLRLSFTTPEDLRADIAILQDLLPRIMIVTHANALKADGFPIETRASFIDMVKNAARAVGVRVYDPTKRMFEMGQSVALADHSAGLAHYSDAFADALCDDWSDLAIAPAIDDLLRGQDNNAVADVLAPHIHAMTGRVPFAALLQRLADLAKDGAPVAPIASGLEVAKRSLDPDLCPAHTAYLLGQYDTLAKTLKTAATLPSPDLMLHYAKDAPAPVAFDILSLGLSDYPETPALAERLAAILLMEDPDAQFEIPEVLQSTLLRHIAPLDRLKLCLAYGLGLQIVAQDLSSDDITDVVAHLALAKGRDVALSFLTRWQGDKAVPVALSGLLAQWCGCQQLDRVQKVRLCRTILAVDPQNIGARTALRDIRRVIRKDMRCMAEAADRVGLDKLAQLNALLPDPLPEVDLIRARASFHAGDFADAVRIGSAAAKVLPENLSVWVLLMRAAHRAQDHVLSARFAEKVVALSTPDTARFAQEAATRVGDARLVPHD